MQVCLLRLRDPAPRGQSQVRFEEQTPQYVAETLVREVPFVKRLDHPIVEEIQFRVEKLVIRLELCTQEPAFRLEFTLDGRARIWQHSAERRDCPTVADEGFQEIDVLQDATKRRVGVDQHEAEVEGESELFQNPAGPQMRLRLQPLAHVQEPFFIARFNPHVDVRQSSGNQPLQDVFLNLVRAATDLERNLTGEARLHNAIGNLNRPTFCISPSRQKVIVLKQKDRDSPVAMQIDHLVDDRLRGAQSPQ